MNNHLAVLAFAVLSAALVPTGADALSLQGPVSLDSGAEPDHTGLLPERGEESSGLDQEVGSPPDSAPPVSGGVDPAASIWERIRTGFRLDEIESPLVARHEAWYLNHREYTRRMIERSRLYLHFIVEEVEKRDMPMEIALLPMIESAYNPNAYSRARASGIWQFIPSTGRKYGLQQNWWYDGRRDVIAATGAALDYLQALHAEFDDWNLALAAYNWGENGLRRAIASNKARRKPAAYSSLRMPRETRNYLPKLQAVKNIVSNPSILSFQLPEVPDQPYFTVVNAAHHIDVEVAAQLAEMSVEDFVALNPAYNRPVITSNGERNLALPVEKADVFRANLERYDQPFVSWQTYTMTRGDTIESLARRFEIDSERLAQINGVTPGRPGRPGRTLLVPMLEGSEASDLADTWDNPEFQSPADYYGTRIVHRVRSGETLSTIARRYRVSIPALREWNGIRGTMIRAGQKLVIYRDPRVPQVSKMIQ
jgi:membrane-bound lytic murein transglycosylase D